MDAIISKELISFDAPKRVEAGGLIDMSSADEGVGKPAPEKTAQFPPKIAAATPSRRGVKIPHNPNIPMSVKRERCRNCVIYNEHQRMKYQFFAPLFVLRSRVKLCQ